MDISLSKAVGCLAGVALGDALGRATEFMTREQIRKRFGWLDHFEAPAPAHPGHADPLGAITDDTAQTLLIARLLISGLPLTPERVAAALVEWARRAPNPYLGPSTRRALERLEQGVSPYETGKGGTTNGAAMRVGAIGIVHAGDPEGALRDAVVASIPTHNSHNAIQGAAAVACAVAEAMQPQATLDTILAAAQEGARRGRAQGEWSWATPLDKRIGLAVQMVRHADTLESGVQALYDYIGVGLDPAESVAAALGLVAAGHGDPMVAIVAGANIGGDTDTIAAIAGGICGAWRGVEALDAGMVQQVQEINGIDLHRIARELVMHKA